MNVGPCMVDSKKMGEKSFPQPGSEQMVLQSNLHVMQPTLASSNLPYFQTLV